MSLSHFPMCMRKARLPHLHRSLVFHMALPVSYASLRYRSRALQRLRELEAENSRLKRIVAQQALDIDVLKEVVSKKW